MPTLTLIRGLSGAGKTTLAETLAEADPAYPGTVTVEADDFFTVNGVYTWVGAKLPEAHAWCQDVADNRLGMGFDVIVSNVFAKNWQLAPYYAIAAKHGAEVRVIEVSTSLTDEQLAARCAHGLTAEMIGKQRAGWEPLGKVGV